MAIKIKTDREIELMRESCRLAAEVLKRAGELVKPGITTELRGDTVHELHSTGTRLGILETLAAPMERGRVGMAVPSTGTELFCCLEVSTFSGVVELLAASPLFPREPAIICCMQRADSNFSNSDAHLSLTIHRFMQ